MKFKVRCLVNTVLVISALILAVSGLALFYQVWIEGIREWHQISGFLFIGASIIHVIINRNALGTSLKTKWAGLAVLVLVVAAVRRGGATHAFDTINHMFQMSRMIIPGSSYWNIGIGLNKGDVEKDDEAMQTMDDLGRNMAWLLKKLKS